MHLNSKVSIMARLLKRNNSIMLKNYFSTNISEKQSSDTGMAIVLILLIIALLTKNDAFIVISAVTLIINMIYPNFYYPFAIIWLGFSHLLGTVVSKIILTIVFIILVIPVSIFRRILGKDSLYLKDFKKSSTSVMKIREHKFSASDIEKPY